MGKIKTPFAAGMYTLVLQGEDSKIFYQACKKQNYDAILDMFDCTFGGMGKDTIMEAPMIVINPQNTLVKTCEKALDATKAYWLAMKVQMLLKAGKGIKQDVFWKFINRGSV